MKKNIIKQASNKYLIFFLSLIAIVIGVFVLKEIVIQRQIDQCYKEVRERYEEDLKNVKDLPAEKTNESRISLWGTEDIETKMKLREQLQKDEDRCLERYR